MNEEREGGNRKMRERWYEIMDGWMDGWMDEFLVERVKRMKSVV